MFVKEGNLFSTGDWRETAWFHLSEVDKIPGGLSISGKACHRWLHWTKEKSYMSVVLKFCYQRDFWGILPSCHSNMLRVIRCVLYQGWRTRRDFGVVVAWKVGFTGFLWGILIVAMLAEHGVGYTLWDEFSEEVVANKIQLKGWGCVADNLPKRFWRSVLMDAIYHPPCPQGVQSSYRSDHWRMAFPPMIKGHLYN